MDTTNETQLSSDSSSLSVKQNCVICFAEIALIFLLFATFTPWQTPGANEAHYLCKAKHYWNPDWCADDHFLNSADAHAIFYWTVGWLTLFFPLPVVAWIGRIFCWFCLALSWQRLSYSIISKPWFSGLTAMTWLFGLQNVHMAGEWVVGGVEAKCIAYAFALWAIGDAIAGKWNRAWILLGIASAFHVLVGGWSVIALFLAWCLYRNRDQPLKNILPGLIIGGLISLTSLVPSLLLSAGQPTEITQEANWIYVFQRLSHHLVFNTFAPNYQLRFGIITAIWLVIYATIYFRLKEQSTEKTQPINLLNGFVLGSVVIAAIGVVIDQGLIFLLRDYITAAALLRFYWFRLSDMAVPMGMAFSIPVIVACLWVPQESVQKIISRLILAATVIAIVFQAYAQQNNNSTQLGLGANKTEEDWKTACLWIRDNTPADSIFLTPRFQKSFKWYAERGEVISTKDVPQDAVNLIEWQERRKAFYLDPNYHSKSFSLGQFSEKKLIELQSEFPFSYIIMNRKLAEKDQLIPMWSFEKIYPTQSSENNTYEIYKAH